MRRNLSLLLWPLGVVLVPAFGPFNGHSALTVTVVSGIEIAPPEMQQVEKPAARYLEDSELVVFVSAPLYSGSCPPSAEAKMDGETLVLDIDDSPEGDCTADANSNTFLVQGFDQQPTRLTVEQGELESVEFNLGD